VNDLLSELIVWLESQTEAEKTFGDDSLAIELATDSPRVTSTGHYQRSVAYQKCLQKLRHLLEERDRE